MKTPRIYLAFTDDWELRGDGSGDIEHIQFEPMRQLLDIFEKHEMRCTFMPEIMQQLTFRLKQEKHPELKPLADRWEEHVRDAYSRGHDIQLHLHTQWSDATYINGKWQLGGSWSILNYSPDDACRMIADGKSYLENLIRPVDPDYECIAFRASYLAAAPSPTLLGQLVDQGLKIETSIVGGLRVDTHDVQIDYRTCQEDFQPFYPSMTDARRLSNKIEPIVCLPIFHFTGSRLGALRQIVAKTKTKMEHSGGAYVPLETSAGRSSLVARVYEKAAKPLFYGKYHTADISHLDGGLMREMLRAIRSRASERRLDHVPIVLTNHSKDLKDFEALDQFLREIAAAGDIKVVTLTELAEMLRAGKFEIRQNA